MSKKNILFFNGRLLPPSETFILAQGEQLQTFTPYYVGARRVPGLALPEDYTLVINKGGCIGQSREALFKLFGFAPQFMNQLKTLSPSLIHAHFGVCGTLALPIVRALKVPLVVTFYGLDATMSETYAKQESVTTRVYLKRKEMLKQETQLFIAVSDFLKEKLLQQDFPEKKVISHYYGVNIELFTPDPVVEREQTVLFVGRLAEKKGCEYLIKAMAKVQAILPDVNLVMIGDGNLRASLEEQASKTLHKYTFLGLQPFSVVKSWMNRAKLLATPSVTAANGDSEGLPTVVVEAQSMGLPVVGTFHAGIPQAVLHGQTGLLAEERDWETLADNIIVLFKHPDLWQDFSVKGRERMLTHFNLKTQTQKLEKFYQDILVH